MKSKIRIAYLSFFLVFILSIFSITVFADEEDDDPVPVTDAPVATQAPPVATVAPKTKPSTQATYKKKATTAATRSTYATKKSTYATRTTQSVNSASRTTQNTNGSVSSTKASTSAVYNVNKEKVATDTLKKNDWASIAEQLSKSDNDDTKTDVENFDYIKNNTAEGDNGIWILYTGIGLEIAAALIIITLIILAVRRKKRYKNARFASEAAPVRNSAPAPAKRQPSKAQKRNVNRRSKFDTDEVNLNRQPRRSGRYKPRH